MSWAIGTLLSIFGSTASNLGVNIQKYSFIRNDLKPIAMQRVPLKDKAWLIGLGLVIFGSLGDFAALSLVAQSIVAPLGSVTLVTNILFAHYWLKEAVGWHELIGTILILIGSTLSVIFGDHSNPTYTDQQLLDLISGGLFISYVVITCSFVIIGISFHIKITPIRAELQTLLSRAHKQQRKDLGLPIADDDQDFLDPAIVRSSHPPNTSNDYYSFRTGVNGAGSTTAITLPPSSLNVPNDLNHHAVVSLGEPDDEGWTVADVRRFSALSVKFQPWASIHPLMLCALSGVIGAQSVLFSKCFSVLLATSASGDNQMLFFFPWVCFISMFICIFTQLYFMAKALSFYGSLYAVPVFQCFFIGVSGAGGACYFREVYAFSTLQIVMYPVGLLLTLCGVAVLTFRGQQSLAADKIQAAAQAAHALQRSGSSNRFIVLPDGTAIEKDNHGDT